MPDMNTVKFLICAMVFFLGALLSLGTITIPVADGAVALVSCAMAFREMHIHEITGRNWKSVRFIFIIYDFIIYDFQWSPVFVELLKR